MENQNENPAGVAPVASQDPQTLSTGPVGLSKSRKIIFIIAGLFIVVAISIAAIFFFKFQKSGSENGAVTPETSKTAKQNTAIKVESDLAEYQKQKIIYNDDGCRAYLSNLDGTEKMELPIDTKYPFCGVAPNGNYYYYFRGTSGGEREDAREFCFHSIADKASTNDYCVEKSTNNDSATEKFFDIRWSSDGRFIVWRKDPQGASFTIVDVTNSNVGPYFNENSDCQAYAWFPVSNRLFCYGAGKFKIIDAEKYVSSNGKEGISEFPMPDSGIEKVSPDFFIRKSSETNLNSIPCAHIAISEDQEKVACNQAKNLVQSESNEVFYLADLTKKEYIAGSSFDSGMFAFSPSGKFLLFTDFSLFFGGDKTSDDEFKNVFDIQDLGTISENNRSKMPYFGTDQKKTGDLIENMLYAEGNIPNLYSKNVYQLKLDPKFAREAITTESLIEESGVVTSKDLDSPITEVNDPASRIKMNVPLATFDATKEITPFQGDQKAETWTLTNKRNKSIFMEIRIFSTKESIDNMLNSAKDLNPSAKKVAFGNKTWMITTYGNMQSDATVFRGTAIGGTFGAEATSNPDAKSIAEKILSSVWIK